MQENVGNGSETIWLGEGVAIIYTCECEDLVFSYRLKQIFFLLILHFDL